MYEVRGVVVLSNASFDYFVESQICRVLSRFLFAIPRVQGSQLIATLCPNLLEPSRDASQTTCFACRRCIRLCIECSRGAVTSSVEFS